MNFADPARLVEKVRIAERQVELERQVDALGDRIQAANPAQRARLLTERYALIVEYRALDGVRGHPC